jgi:hypothetical protein
MEFGIGPGKSFKKKLLQMLTARRCLWQWNWRERNRGEREGEG